jgi:hypothetical protein
MTDLPEELANLLSEDPKKRCYLLRRLSHRPSGDPRVLPYLERLLEDRAPCLFSIPYEYGEVRYRAAEALAAERQAQGISEPVRVRSVVVPLTANRLFLISEAEGLPPALTWQARFERLRDLGKLPVEDLELPPGLAVC